MYVTKANINNAQEYYTLHIDIAVNYNNLHLAEILSYK